jgi:hypothetical protein
VHPEVADVSCVQDRIGAELVEPLARCRVRFRVRIGHDRESKGAAFTGS